MKLNRKLCQLIHQIHDSGADWVWSEFSWNQGILGCVEYIFCPVLKPHVLVLDSKFTCTAAIFMNSVYGVWFDMYVNLHRFDSILHHSYCSVE